MNADDPALERAGRFTVLASRVLSWLHARHTVESWLHTTPMVLQSAFHFAPETAQSMSCACGIDQHDLDEILVALLRAGIVEQKANGLWVVVSSDAPRHVVFDYGGACRAAEQNNAGMTTVRGQS